MKGQQASTALKLSPSPSATVLLSSADTVPCSRAGITNQAWGTALAFQGHAALLAALLAPWTLGCSCGGSEELCSEELPMLVPGLGAESVGEFVFISIYCCWELRGGLCRGSEVLCCSSPHTIGEG